MRPPTLPYVDSAHPSAKAPPESLEPLASGQNATGNTWHIYCGDALTVLSHLDDNTIDCVVTSPPYFWLRDYGTPNQIGLEETVDEYLDSIDRIMQQVKRILKPHGLVFLNISDTFYSGKGMSHGKDEKSKKRRFGLRAVDKSGGLGINLQRKSLIGIPWRLGIRLIDGGWALRSSVIWCRPNGLVESVTDRPSRSYEQIFILAKSRNYYFNKEALPNNRSSEDIWYIPTQHKSSNGIGTAPFPDQLVEICLNLGCIQRGSVLDPFLGSGTTVRVALSTDRSAIGVELNPEYCKFAVQSMRGRR